jgi:excisionase family DNA binding protein
MDERTSCRDFLRREREANKLNEQQNTLTPRQAARYMGISEAALRLWRSRGEGPRYFRAGDKLVRYRRADLDMWIESRLSEPENSGSRVVSARHSPDVSA